MGQSRIDRTDNSLADSGTALLERCASRRLGLGLLGVSSLFGLACGGLVDGRAEEQVIRQAEEQSTTPPRSGAEPDSADTFSCRVFPLRMGCEAFLPGGRLNRWTPSEVTCEENPLLEGCGPAIQIANSDTADSLGILNFQSDVAQSVLIAMCGGCHGSQLPDSQVRGGIDFIDDWEQLFDAGLAIPLDSANSPIVQVMRDGRMPPPQSRVARPSDGDIQTIVAYLDNPIFFPELDPDTVDSP